ncbi:MAG: ATP phosphoribosyltransferase regulatory subunit [Chloroflexota bacterium]
MADTPSRLIVYEDERLTLLISRLHTHLQRAGYQHAQVDAIKDADLFLNKAGDQIIANLFTFERFGRQLALRPEFTALAVQRYIQTHPDGKAVIRWQFNGSVFRDDYRRKGQDYQIMSAGAELFGMQDAVLADAEIISLATTGLTQVTGINTVKIVVGHIGLVRALLATYELDSRTERLILNNLNAMATGMTSPDDIMMQFDRYVSVQDPALQHDDTGQTAHEDARRMLDVMLDATERGATMGGRKREDIVNRMIKKRRLAARRQTIMDAVTHIHRFVTIHGSLDAVYNNFEETTTDPHFKRLLNEWRQSIDLLREMTGQDVQIDINTGLARDWNYYSGMVFELVDSQTDTRYGGGGRYDELVRMVGDDVDVPAVGFAYDIDAVLTRASYTQGSSGKIFNMVSTTGNHTHTFAWADALRGAGLSVALQEASYSGDNIIRVTETNATFGDQTAQTPEQLIAIIQGKQSQ